MTVYQTPTTDFAQHADALEASCNDLIGQTINKVSTSSPNGVASADVINNNTCQQVAKAIDKVGNVVTGKARQVGVSLPAEP